MSAVATSPVSTATAVRRPARKPNAPTAVLGRSTARFVVLLLLLLALPLPLGCAGPAARAWATLAVGGIAAWVLLRAQQRRGGLYLPAGTALAAAFLAVPCLQLLPIGLGVDAAAFGLPVVCGSLVPAHTAQRLAELASCLALALAAAQLFGDAARLRRFAAVGLGLAVASVAYGAAAQHGLLPLLDAEQTRTVMVGTFVNRNHLGDLLAMLGLLGAGLVLAQHARGASLAARAGAVAGVGVAALGIVATESRGALAAFVAGLLVLSAVGFPSVRVRSIVVVGAAIVGVVLWTVPLGLAARFQHATAELFGSGARADIWRGAVDLWATAPVFGTGLGTYGDLSPATQPIAVPGRVEHAHCDLLEVLTETGLVGALLSVAAVLAFGISLSRRCRRHTDRPRALLAAGGFAALAAFVVHGLVEFPLQIPANAYWAAAIAGAMAGGMRSRSAEPSSTRIGWCVLAVVGATIALAATRLAVPQWFDARTQLAAGAAAAATDPAKAAEHARAALGVNPCSPGAHRLLGEALLASEPAAAERAFAAALAWTNPADRPRHQLAVACTCLAAGQNAQAARWLGSLLPTQPSEPLRRLLDELYDAVPAAELLVPLLPTEPPDVMATFAEVMLRRGDFAGRERALLALRPSHPNGLLTLRDGVVLTTAEAPVVATAAGLEVHVALTFAGADANAPVPVVLRCEAPGAAIYRSFSVDAAAFRHVLHLGPTFPPGSYTLSLDFRADAPHFPFASIDVAPRAVVLASGRAVPAGQLFWNTRDPGRRIQPAEGVPLRGGDVLWCDAEWSPDAAVDLIVRTLAASALAATLDDRELAAAGAGAATAEHRFPLPAGRGGRLTITAIGADEPVVREILVVRRDDR